MIGVITIGINPVALQLGPLSIHWYGIAYAVAFYVGYRFGVLPEARRRGFSKATVERIVVTTIVVGLIGGRLYYVVQQPNLVSGYLEHPLQIIAVWDGGMAFFGAILASALTLLWFARRDHHNFWMMLDIGALFAVIGQPIGRLGNVVNGDILGSRSDAWFATAYTFPSGVGHCAVLQPGYLCGVGYQPAAVYEALGTIAIGLVLMLLRRRHPAAGMVGITYIALYGVSQFVIPFFRDSEPVIGLGLRQLQWTALVVLVLAVPALVLVRRRWPGPSPAAAVAAP